MATITNFMPCLWFDTEAEEAASLYTSIFADSKILQVERYGDAGPRAAGMVMTVIFELGGQRFMALNGGPEFHFTEAVSFFATCEDQAEVDRVWAALTDEGQGGPCGWCKDRFGLSWQVVPAVLSDLIGDTDPVRAQGALQAMFQMSKLDIEGLRRGADEAAAAAASGAAS